MVPAWVMIICWIYLEFWVITWTDKQWLVPPIYLFCGLTSLFFFSHEKKISQILESLARKWNTLERNGLAAVATWLMQRESITRNSNFSSLKLVLVVPCSASYPGLTVYDKIDKIRAWCCCTWIASSTQWLVFRMIQSLPHKIGTLWVGLLYLTPQSKPGRTQHKVTHKSGIEPGSPGLKLNTLSHRFSLHSIRNLTEPIHAYYLHHKPNWRDQFLSILQEVLANRIDLLETRLKRMSELFPNKLVPISESFQSVGKCNLTWGQKNCTASRPNIKVTLLEPVEMLEQHSPKFFGLR